MFLLVTFLIEFEVYITVNSSLCCIIVIQLEYVFLTLNATFYLILILLINFFFIYYFILTRKIQRRKCNLRCNFELNKVLILFRIQFIQLSVTPRLRSWRRDAKKTPPPSTHRILGINNFSV